MRGQVGGTWAGGFGARAWQPGRTLQCQAAPSQQVGRPHPKSRAPPPPSSTHIVGGLAVHDGSQRVHRLVVDLHVQQHQVVLAVACAQQCTSLCIFLWWWWCVCGVGACVCGSWGGVPRFGGGQSEGRQVASGRSCGSLRPRERGGVRTRVCVAGTRRRRGGGVRVWGSTIR